ncbi:hypothetical protein C7212DRAFT_363531 [Tuber magnatum]|uniref:Uncharacterized protein n=1 Tax=Tuber magnatum TaxID=42249 RepID=A0A317SQ77_9PEZI|nr:hypothetical protein C7212DRAFT_363531 [Tuber magnatum]
MAAESSAQTHGPQMSSPDSEKLQIRYRYLLFRKNGSVCPLVAAEDLPAIVTVIPPPDMIGGITLVQEIAKSSGGGSPGLPRDKVRVNGTQREFENGDDENDRIGAVLPDPLHSCLSQAGKIHTCAIPGSNTSSASQREEETPGNGRFYLHPNHSQVKLQNGNSPFPLPEAPTARESRLKASGLFKKDLCQSFLRDAACKWGSECTFRHETPVRPEKWQKANSVDAQDGTGSPGDAFCRLETDEDHGNQCSSDGGEVDGGSGITAVVSSAAEGESHGINPKGKKTELCAYFHRKIGCRRGKDCFYLHENGSGTFAGEKYHCPKRGSNGTSSPTTPKKMEGEWRRVASPISDTSSGEKKVSQDSPATAPSSGLLGVIACPTPGRIQSATDPLKHIKTHCTFFLRFGECDYWPSCKFSHERPEGVVTPLPSLSPTPASGFTRWRGSRTPAEKLDTRSIKKILTREDGNGGIALPGPQNIERLAVGGRFSLLNRIPNGNTLQKAFGGISDSGEISRTMQRITPLIPSLTKHQFKYRQFIRTFHPSISQRQRYNRINRPIGLSRRHETPDPLLPPDIFKPEDLNGDPEELFQPLFGAPGTPASPLYRVNDPKKALIYINGTSIGNGSPDAIAGCGVYRSPNESLNICRSLPVGTTNNRAELWAALYALELIAREPSATDAATSPPDGCQGGGGTIVDSWIIASDSTYIVMGATNWAWKRRANGWKGKGKNNSNMGEMEMELSEDLLGRGLVPNADLWDRLLRGIMNIRGQILFWQIRRVWNRAHGLARRGAFLRVPVQVPVPEYEYRIVRCRHSTGIIFPSFSAPFPILNSIGSFPTYRTDLQN